MDEIDMDDPFFAEAERELEESEEFKKGSNNYNLFIII